MRKIKTNYKSLNVCLIRILVLTTTTPIATTNPRKISSIFKTKRKKFFFDDESVKFCKTRLSLPGCCLTKCLTVFCFGFCFLAFLTSFTPYTAFRLQTLFKRHIFHKVSLYMEQRDPVLALAVDEVIVVVS